VIAPRATRLIRTADLRAFRAAVVDLATAGSAVDARHRLVIVPTHAAASHLLRTMEDARVGGGRAFVRPDIATPGELVTHMAWRLDAPLPTMGEAEREVLLGMACRATQDAGVVPPFRMRPALIAEALHFYDELRRHQKHVDAFERLVLGTLEPSAAYDRGAERLVQQTRFLVAAFRDFEARCASLGLDEHRLRAHLLTAPAARAYRHVVVAVTSRAFSPHGLTQADWDLLTRVPGLARLDIVVTDRALVGAPHEWFHSALPGMEETRFDAGVADTAPVGLIPSEDTVAHTARDREEEVADFARRARRALRAGDVPSLDRVALVVRQPLPYLYLGREVLRSAAMPCQTFDALPLAAEPLAAALDLILTCATSAFARTPLVALCRCPHFRFGVVDDDHRARDLTALDRALSEAGYLGQLEALDSLVASWEREARGGTQASAARAGRAALDISRDLATLGEGHTAAAHLTTMIEFWRRHERLPVVDDAVRSRLLRARAAILGLLGELRDAHARFDDAVVTIEEVSALIRRWVEARTFAPPADAAGLHIVDAVSAPFGEFAFVQLAGLIEGEWPSAARHDTFYSGSILRELGWPSERDRLEGARAAFEDLLQLPSRYRVVSTFRLEMDSLVTPSPFLDGLDRLASDVIETFTGDVRMFDHEALSLEPLVLEPLARLVRDAARHRLQLPSLDERQFHGFTAAHAYPSFSPGSIEQYQDCPFKFFAGRVLRLEEPPDDGSTLSPRARGRLVHDIFQRFFERWDASGGGPITPERMAEARSLLVRVAEPLLDRLPEAERMLERARLFGSPVAIGAGEVVLGLEASRPTRVVRRWLEYVFEGAFTLGRTDGRRLSLRGVADRIDLLDDGRLRVIDYKTGRISDRSRALQVPLYALCAQERFTDDAGQARDVAEAGYVTFGDKKPFTAVVDLERRRADDVLAGASDRVFELVDAVDRGEFPPRPHNPTRCRFCAYGAVCRKDYVGDD